MLVLHGKPGTGKTSSIAILAAENKLEVVEVNSSDFRTYNGTIQMLTKMWMTQQSFGKQSLLVFEEMDGGYTQDGKSPVTAVTDFYDTVLKKSKALFKIVVTCNNVYDLNIKQKLAHLAVFVEFKALGDPAMISLLTKLTNERDVKLDNRKSREIIAISGGDARQLKSNLDMYLTTMNDGALFSAKDFCQNVFDTIKVFWAGKLDSNVNLCHYGQDLAFTNYPDVTSNIHDMYELSELFSLSDSMRTLEMTDFPLPYKKKLSFLKPVHKLHYQSSHPKKKFGRSAQLS